MTFVRFIAPAALALALSSCSQETKQETKKGTEAKVTYSNFGRTSDGKGVELYTLTNGKGMEAKIMTLGAAVVSLTAPDKNGNYADVVLGMDKLEGYLGGVPYFGAVVGRYGNRIAKGQFTLEGQAYKLAVNNGENSLHGGLKGFDKQVWTAKDAEGGVEFTYVSRDGEEGYPGTLTAKVLYTVTPENELKLEYTATTDKPTVVNLTNHSYFNLAGEGDILQHQVMIDADRFTPVDQGLIPTGELKPVEGTPFDFRKPTAIGARIDQPDEQLKFGGGYDHNWVLNGSGMRKAAEVYEPKTGRVMEVLTQEPGLQFYTGNFLDGTITGKGGRAYQKRAAFCMETQHFPDSPNKPSFPTTELKPGQTYHTVTVYRFSAR
jgi:aldose 1-epimerase